MITGRTWREARRYALPTLGLGIALLAVSRPRGGLASLATAGAVVFFFRDPERPLDPRPDLVYAAADGVITHVEPADDDWLEQEGLRISTFLAIYDVHVNRSPVEGTVTRTDEISGGFAPAFLGRASQGNRQHRLAIEGRRGPAVVIQVAGMVARTISRWVEVGDRLLPGQRMGLIHFGSRTDVLLPADAADALVSPGEHVHAGVSPIARYRSA